MKDYRVEIKIKNNLLYNAIVGEYGSIKKFCETFHFSQCYIGDLINMKIKSIYKNKSTELKDTVKRLCDSLGKSICELFPTQYYLENNKIAIERDKKELVSLESCSEALSLTGPDTDMIINRAEMKKLVKKAIQTLSPREQYVIESRYFDGKTQKEIGQEMNVTGQMIQVIENRAIKKLRHPSRSRNLKEYIAIAEES